MKAISNLQVSPPRDALVLYRKILVEIFWFVLFFEIFSRFTISFLEYIRHHYIETGGPTPALNYQPLNFQSVQNVVRRL